MIIPYKSIKMIRLVKNNNKNEWCWMKKIIKVLNQEYLLCTTCNCIFASDYDYYSHKKLHVKKW
jgi:hypothetical protein